MRKLSSLVKYTSKHVFMEVAAIIKWSGLKRSDRSVTKA